MDIIIKITRATKSGLPKRVRLGNSSQRVAKLTKNGKRVRRIIPGQRYTLHTGKRRKIHSFPVLAGVTDLTWMDSETP